MLLRIAGVSLMVGVMVLMLVQLTAAAQPVSPTLSANALDATSTFIIAAATQTESDLQTMAAASLPGAAPTMSHDETEQFARRWTNELETAAGFSHPVFSYIAYQVLNAGGRGRWGSNQGLRAIVTRTTYNGSDYVAMVLPELFLPFGSADVWMFRLTNGSNPILLSNTDGFVPHFGYLSEDFNEGQFRFGDVNGNGRPDLVLKLTSAGSCPNNGIEILEVQDNGDVLNVANSILNNSDFSADVANERMEDVIHQVDLMIQNGETEVKVTYRVNVLPGLHDYTCDSFLPLVRYFRWEGTAYKDITATLSVSDYPDIDRYFTSITGKSCLLPDAAMNQMLIDYAALGRLSEGWARLAPRLQWDKCSPAALEESGETMGALLTWTGKYLKSGQYG
jgi:hypothetical protein